MVEGDHDDEQRWNTDLNGCDGFSRINGEHKKYLRMKIHSIKKVITLVGTPHPVLC